jgi:hypothetical protein
MEPESPSANTRRTFLRTASFAAGGDQGGCAAGLSGAPVRSNRTIFGQFFENFHRQG